MKRAVPIRRALCLALFVSVAMTQTGCLSYLATTDDARALDTVGYFTIDAGLGAATGTALWAQCETSRVAPCLPGTGNRNGSEWAASLAWGLGTALVVDGLVALFFYYANEDHTDEPD